MQQDMFRLIASRYETPTYVFDMQNLSQRVELIRSRLPAGTMLCFAMKANPFLAGILAKQVDRLEVCSPGEYEICIREQIDPEKIVVSGVNKTVSSMERILSYSHGAGIYTIESELHYRILKQCTEGIDKRLKVLLRLSSGNQFGMDESTLERVLAMIQADNLMDVMGIHYYAGTQKKMPKIESELNHLNTYGGNLQDKYHIRNMELEYGPGLMVSYFDETASTGSDTPDTKEQLDLLNGLLKGMDTYGHISIELGRFLTSDCGYYMTRIMDIKHTGKTGFVIVDGGIHQINYYGQMMGMKKPYMQLIKMPEHTQDMIDNTDTCTEKTFHLSDTDVGKPTDIECSSSTQNANKWTICGSLCTVNDVLVRQIELDNFDIGDILVFERCGAYAVTEGMALFLSRELPQVLLMDLDGNIQILREKTEINLLNGKMEENKHGEIN